MSLVILVGKRGMFLLDFSISGIALRSIDLLRF